jgi:hypothetical protein
MAFACIPMAIALGLVSNSVCFKDVDRDTRRWRGGDSITEKFIERGEPET